MAHKTKPAPPGKARAKKTTRTKKQGLLANVMTGPEVRKALGGVSHVTVHNLTFKGDKPLKIVGKAKGGGYLWNAEIVRKFAKGYKPQRNPPPGKGKRSRKSRAKRAGKGRATRLRGKTRSTRAVAGA